MNKLFTVLSVLVVFTTASCRKVVGDGPVQTETRAVPDFDAIDVGMGADVTYTPASVARLELRAQANILGVIETYVQSGRLKIKFRDRVNVRNHERIHINVSGLGLRALGLSGSGRTNVSGTMQGPSLRMEISGSGDLYVAGVQADYLSASVSGSGSIRVGSGAVNRAEVHVSGSGDADLGELTAQFAETHTSGSGTIRVHAQQQLEAHISGRGKVYYRGQPVVTTHISGSGRVLPY